MDNVEELLDTIKNEIALRVRCLISLCESPIETLFLSNFLKQHIPFNSFGEYDLAFEYESYYCEAIHDLSEMIHLSPPPLSKSFEPYQPGVYCSAIRIISSSGFVPVDASLKNIKEINVCPQSKIIVDGNEYRVDFELTYTLFTSGNEKKYKIVIECDGHEFHEKTKEQATRDKQRDRALQRKGYIVLRYSGSEIYFNRNYTEFRTILKEIEAIVATRYKSDQPLMDASIESGQYWKVS